MFNNGRKMELLENENRRLREELELLRKQETSKESLLAFPFNFRIIDPIKDIFGSNYS